MCIEGNELFAHLLRIQIMVLVFNSMHIHGVFACSDGFCIDCLNYLFIYNIFRLSCYFMVYTFRGIYASGGIILWNTELSDTMFDCVC